MINNIINNLRRCVINRNFLFCSLAVCLLCLTSTGYSQYCSDPVMIFEFLLNTKLIGQGIDSTGYAIFSKMNSGWFYMFAPVLAAFPFIYGYCSDISSQYTRCVIHRIGKLPFYISSVLSAMTVGGLVLTVGYALYGVIVCTVFPSLPELISHDTESFATMVGTIYPEWYTNFLLNGNFFLPFVLHLSIMFFYGGINVLPALIITLLSSNRYVVICVPFFLTYAYSQILMKINYAITTNFSESLIPLWEFISMISPTSVFNLIDSADDALVIVAIHGGFAVLLCVVFCVVLHRKVDCCA